MPDRVKAADHSSEHKSHLRWFDTRSPIVHTPPIQLAKSTCDQTITADFKLTGIREALEEGSLPHVWTTEPFGQGWHLKIGMWNEPDEETIYLGAFLDYWNQQRALDVSVTFSLYALDRDFPLTSARFTHKMLPREDWGFSRLAPKSQFWAEDGPVKRDNACVISIHIHSTSVFRPSESLEGTLRPAAKAGLVRSLKDPSVVDTKFVLLHSRPTKGGTVSRKHIRPVWCSSHLLMELSPYFRSMLANDKEQGFSESGLLRDIFDDAVDYSIFEDSYDYSSDSDLSDEESESADSGVNSDNKASSSSDLKNDSPKPLTRRMGKVVPIKDVAYKTWLAMIFYLQTGEINFAALGSEGSRRHNSRRRCTSDHVAVTPGCPGFVSCKSVFRVADKLGLTDLEKIALEYLQLQLTSDNVVEELFSNFTSRYEKVREIEIAFAVENWASVQLSKSFQHKFDLFSEGQLPRGKDIIKHLLTNVRPKQLQSPKKNKTITVAPYTPYPGTGGWTNWTPYGPPPTVAPPILVPPGGGAATMTASSATNSPQLIPLHPAPGPNEAGPGPGPLIL